VPQHSTVCVYSIVPPCHHIIVQHSPPHYGIEHNSRNARITAVCSFVYTHTRIGIVSLSLSSLQPLFSSCIPSLLHPSL
jgi:hypothetical protein